MTDTYADLGGGIYDPNEAPACSLNCDGKTGMSRAVDPDDRVPVPCPVHRPHLARTRHRGTRYRMATH